MSTDTDNGAAKSKNIVFSKMVWFNILTSLLGALALFGVDSGLTNEEKLALASMLVTLQPAVNVLLRMMTKQPVHVLPKK